MYDGVDLDGILFSTSVSALLWILRILTYNKSSAHITTQGITVLAPRSYFYRYCKFGILCLVREQLAGLAALYATSIILL